MYFIEALYTDAFVIEALASILELLYKVSICVCMLPLTDDKSRIIEVLIPFKKQHDNVDTLIVLILLICALHTLVLSIDELIVLLFNILVFIKEEQTIDEHVCILLFIVLTLIYETFAILEESVLHVKTDVFVLVKELFRPYDKDTFVTEAVKLEVYVSLPTNDDVEQHTQTNMTNKTRLLLNYNLSRNCSIRQELIT